MDVFFEYNYGKIYEPIEDGTCEVFNFSCEFGSVRYLFIKRKISRMKNAGLKEQFFDIVTPYGYGGPIVENTTDIDSLLSAYFKAFSDFCLENNIVSEFVRFHLFDNREVRSTFYGDVSVANLNVVRELETPIDELWMLYRRKVRKNVKRAVDTGLKIKVDLTGQHLSEFLLIYYQTMKRNDASQYYFFDKSYFERINSELLGKYAYFHGLLNGKVISSELVLFGDRYSYSFLGGTLKEYYSYRPNDFLKHEIIKWCKKQGHDYFVLGGGYKRNDGIYRYKKAFAKNGDVPFYVGKKVHNQAVYDKLVISSCGDCSTEQTTDFFPAYRAGVIL